MTADSILLAQGRLRPIKEQNKGPKPALKSGGAKMKNLFRVLLAILLISTTASAADKADKDKTKQDERLKNAGAVMGEILDIPDNIPQDLLDKARCVVVIPSVVKAAFLVGGSYGRGAMVCRTGNNMTGSW